MKRAACWLWKRKLWLLIPLAIAIVAVNAVAYMHAYRMTHFIDAGARTAPPEKLFFIAKLGVLVTGVRFPRPTNSTTPAAVGLDFEAHHIVVDSNVTLEAWLVRAPHSKGLVILFHSYGASKSSLIPAARVFHEFGYNVMLVDFRGGGGSSGSVTTIGYHEADDVVAAIQYAKSTFAGDPILYGASMGAAAILRAIATSGISPKALILESPFDRLLSAVENRFDAMNIPSFPLARLLVFWGGAQHGYWGFGHDPVAYASAAKCPALVLHGALDRRVTTAQARAVAENLPSGGSLHAIANAGHVALLTESADEWQTAVSGFLHSLPKSP